MNVLVINGGSSSVKFQLSNTEAPAPAARGRVERLGSQAHVTLARTGEPVTSRGRSVPDHAAAVRLFLEWLDPESERTRIDAVGHRIVHGGDALVQPVLIDEDVLAAIEAASVWAPLHNAPGVAGIRAVREVLGASVPMVAVFDTAFHATLPPHAAQYAIPAALAARHRIRRYGFHGLSYRSVVGRYAAITGRPAPALVALHLGHGCSAAAIRDGRSVDTSMGLTPLEGLVMGTRSGDLDPAVIFHLARAERVELDEVERWLNERSGLAGLAGTGDVRDLLGREPSDPRARLALDVFCYRARKYVGAYLAALGGAEAVIFTGGIGEHQPQIRARIVEGLAWCGVALDPGRNAAAVGGDADIGAAGGRIGVRVIATDEERVIAEDVATVVGAPATSRRAR